jgi:hypothetical protein
VLERKGRLRGWNKQVEVSGVLSQLDLSPEQIRKLEATGLSLNDVFNMLIAMVEEDEVGADD